MGGLRSSTQWIPEDDLLLKNAVEAGASLEALAKGAVCFSRRFTLHELQDRWKSLLYDPDTSAEASARMFEIEFELTSSNPTKSNRGFNVKKMESLSGKRKTDSVQSHYYAMRKRIQSEPFSSNLGFFVPSVLFTAIGSVSRTQNTEPVDNFTLETIYENIVSQPYDAENVGLVQGKISDGTPGEGCFFGHSENYFSYEHNFPQKAFPYIRGENNVSVSTSSVDDWDSLKLDGEKMIEAPQCDMGPSGDGMYTFDNPAALTEDEIMNFSDMYMYFSDDDDVVFPGGDENDVADSSRLNYVSTTRLGFPVEVKSNDRVAAEILETGNGISDAACSKEPNVLCDQIQYSLPNYHSTSFPGVNMPSTSSQTTNMAKPQEEFMFCAFNTEHPEIPNNDHVDFSNLSFPPLSSIQDQSSKETTGLVSSANAVSMGERAPVRRDLNKVMDDAANAKPTVSLKIGSMEVESSQFGSVADVYRYTVAEMREESPSSDDDLAAFASCLEDDLQGTDDDAIGYPSSITDIYHEEEIVPSLLQACIPSDTGLSDTMAIKSTLDQEERFSDSEDDDVPHFSDIEALILDMDLGAYDEDSCLFSNEASRYPHKNTIRWEQGFHSRMNRSIFSRGAFAVFYGRHLKYFIKDREVSIGRETEEVKVDIDLGGEGRAKCSISRRQAIINMDEKGVFYLSNIGRRPIFVNGKEVPGEKRIMLRSCSTVEIQAMHFMFEVNKSVVSSYIMNLQ